MLSPLRWIAMPLLSPLLGVCAVHAAPSLAAALDMAMIAPARPQPWTLIVREADMAGAPLADEVFAQFVEDQDLAVLRLGHLPAQKLWYFAGWDSGPRWLLVSRDRKKILEFKGSPTGALIAAALADQGYQTTWDRREAFLRDHPGQGEALEEKLVVALARATLRLQARLRGPAPVAPLLTDEADLIFQEAAEALHGLIQAPDGWRLKRIARITEALDRTHPTASPHMRGLLTGLRDQVRQAWSLRPRSEGGTLGVLWITLERCLEEGKVWALPDFLPAPGEIWPRWADLALSARPLWLQQDWEDLLAFLNTVPPSLPPACAGPPDWDEFQDRQARICLLKAVVQGKAERWKEAEINALDCRRWAGKNWPALAGAAGQALGVDPSKGAKDFGEVLGLDPIEPPSRPAKAPPLRLALRATAGDALRTNPAFAPWGPGELQWSRATPQDAQFLATWGGPGLDWAWALFQEPASLLSQGPDLTRPEAITSILAHLAPPALATLGEFIQHNPDHLDTRRKRAYLLRQRMPCPPLEPRLAEDTALAVLPAPPVRGGGWAPSPKTWSTPLGQALPDLEDALRRWPTNPALWLTWVSWVPLLSSPPSVATFARSLPVWGHQGLWACRLPMEVHEAVMGQALAEGRLGEASSWFAMAWEGLLDTVEDLPPETAPAIVDGIHRCYKAILAENRPKGTPWLEAQWKELRTRLRPPEKAPAKPLQERVFDQLVN